VANVRDLTPQKERGPSEDYRLRNEVLKPLIQAGSRRSVVMSG
jgi:hypothetical protein